SNSFRSDDWQYNAVGLLHEEMRRAGSLILMCADKHQVPAGGALAVDREGFSEAVTATLMAHPLVSVVREEVTSLMDTPWTNIVCATGPLTSEALSKVVLELGGEGHLSFFDAIAPIVHYDSIDMSKAWKQSRYDKEGPGGDAAAYINCPMDREQYEAFIDALLNGPKAEFKDWEHVPYFDGCLPIEVMAERGRETLRYGPMKPVESPKLLDRQLRLKAAMPVKSIRFAGQITGVEGYVESAAIGLLAGRFAAAEAKGTALPAPPETTALGALINHITVGHLDGGAFQPMNINYGLLPPMEAPKADEAGVKIPLKERGRAKKRLMSLRALNDLNSWLEPQKTMIPAE
ncbi:MAG: methylenetetrahydrofolate--tRNA-(uracil(54)-C(5))-methyltransferase (FADH(2)-oxidizing) TrmFO, partial [Asticcacaulis sp.]|nr:methylenetetrahydrofolate--tRNA-(uracil(54)-C(5))-methyltransferase (FADH(2)-oxidizing) TrmFO [Asticcacaulis sp.]